VLKKAVILFLALLYINVSSGLGVQFHYCMGEIVSIALGHHADHQDTCGDCGMEANENSCCKDESFLLKVSDGHQPSTVSFHPFKYVSAPWFDAPALTQATAYSGVRCASFPSRSFADWQTNKRYIAIRVFRI